MDSVTENETVNEDPLPHEGPVEVFQANHGRGSGLGEPCLEWGRSAMPAEQSAPNLRQREDTVKPPTGWVLAVGSQSVTIPYRELESIIFTR